MKKIIVPVDFSEHSNYALETAAILAKKINAEILAIHMLEMSENVITSSDTEQNANALFYLKLAEKEFDSVLKQDFLEGIKVTPIIKHYKVFKELNDVALEQNADLIVMGSHGSSGAKEYFVGSNTEKVVRHSNIPVLVIKNKPFKSKMDIAVFACDFKEEAIGAYINAKNMFKLLNTQMFLLYVNLPSENFLSSTAIEKKVFNFLMKAEGSSESMNDVHYVSDYSVEKGILNFTNKIKADLIAIPTHGRKGISHFFEGSISEDLANHSTMPVMTFKIQK